MPRAARALAGRAWRHVLNRGDPRVAMLLNEVELAAFVPLPARVRDRPPMRPPA